MRPALFINSRNDMRINREEVFGPIACVIRVRDFEEALATLNDTEYGLTAGSSPSRCATPATSSAAPRPAA